MAYLLAKALELKLRAAGLQLTAARALDLLSRLQAVEHTWEEQAVEGSTLPTSGRWSAYIRPALR